MPITSSARMAPAISSLCLSVNIWSSWRCRRSVPVRPFLVDPGVTEQKSIEVAAERHEAAAEVTPGLNVIDKGRCCIHRSDSRVTVVRQTVQNRCNGRTPKPIHARSSESVSEIKDQAHGDRAYYDGQSVEPFVSELRRDDDLGKKQRGQENTDHDADELRNHEQDRRDNCPEDEVNEMVFRQTLLCRS